MHSTHLNITFYFAEEVKETLDSRPSTLYMLQFISFSNWLINKLIKLTDYKSNYKRMIMMKF